MLITDDEILGVTFGEGTAWPGLLPTVPLNDLQRASAGLRGLRSLLVRDLAQTDDAKVTFDPQLAVFVGAFTSGAPTIGIHPAEIDHITTFCGAGSLIALPPFGDAVVASMTMTGVHGFAIRTDDVTAELVSTVEQIVNAPVAPGGQVGLLVYGRPQPGEQAIWCAPGQLLEGTLARTDPPSSPLRLDDRKSVNLERVTKFIHEISA